MSDATFLLGDAYDNAVYRWNKTVTYDYKNNTMLVKFHNDGCSQEYYKLDSKLLLSNSAEDGIYDPSTGQSVESSMTPTGEVRIKAGKSYAKYGDCFDVVVVPPKISD